ncbi:hypothetical protein Pint_34777 [Pistacia integerrima]|uniref:Uncharacterized protein n=1 Tax=Pistacia integerrima TaxID=434235 RepID=A0ACC0X9V6_9ROSI|nr:hypothetical protein Pint_34777 [Pistacia integerrima]
MAMEMAKKSQKDESLQHEIDGFFCLSSEDSLEESNDLSYWEFVNPSDADSDDIEIDNLSLDSFQNGLFVSWHSLLSSSRSTPEENQTEKSHLDVIDRDQLVGADDDGGDDVDDELVPWSVSGKLGRQRMRKLGKRAFAKMHHSKKTPFLYMKPGCVHGKHGLGMKHSF